MQKIPDVTLLMLADLDIPEATYAVNKSCEEIEWGAVKFLSSKGRPESLCDQAVYEEVYPINSINDFNFYCIYNNFSGARTKSIANRNSFSRSISKD